MILRDLTPRLVWRRTLYFINNIVYTDNVRCKELKRWLAQQGATFKLGKGSHLKVYLNGRQSVLPMHNAELKKGTVEAIKKQLGLK
jgi:mRNA interferase HicA